MVDGEFVLEALKLGRGVGEVRVSLRERLADSATGEVVEVGLSGINGGGGCLGLRREMAGEAKGFGEGKAWERVEGRSIYIGG